MVRRTALAAFPDGWGPAEVAFTGVHETVHVYRARDAERYDMVYETNDGARSFGLAQASSVAGPWRLVDPEYATPGPRWTDEVSHGEAVRIGFDERLESDPGAADVADPGSSRSGRQRAYSEIPWRLGLMSAPGPEEASTLADADSTGWGSPSVCSSGLGWVRR